MFEVRLRRLCRVVVSCLLHQLPNLYSKFLSLIFPAHTLKSYQINFIMYLSLFVQFHFLLVPKNQSWLFVEISRRTKKSRSRRWKIPNPRDFAKIRGIKIPNPGDLPKILKKFRWSEKHKPKILTGTVVWTF